MTKTEDVRTFKCIATFLVPKSIAIVRDLITKLNSCTTPPDIKRSFASIITKMHLPVSIMISVLSLTIRTKF